MRSSTAALAAALFCACALRAAAQTPPPESTLIIIEGQDQQAQKRQEEETRKALREASEALREAARQGSTAVAIPAPLATLKGVPGVESLVAATSVKIDADFDNVPLRDALRKLFGDAKADFDIEDGVKTDTRVFLKARSIRLASALQALADQANVQWTSFWKLRNEDGKFKVWYRILPSPRFGTAFPAPPTSIFSPRVPSAIADVPQPPFRAGSFVINTTEQRRVFHCPYCQGEVTTVKPRKGARSRSEWKFCPLCGKPVDMEEDDEDERAVSVDRIEPGFQVRILIVTPDERVFNRTCSIDSSGHLRLGTYPITVNVAGYTTGKLEQVLAARLRNYVNEPKVTATIVSRK